MTKLKVGFATGHSQIKKSMEPVSRCIGGLLSSSILVKATVAVVLLASVPADASVFLNGSRWPMTSSGASAGYTIIPVCIKSNSSTEEKNNSGLTVHDQNPSLASVIGRVRFALSSNWEKHSNVRFVGWKFCEELTAAEQGDALAIYIHPDAPNNSYVGTGSKGRSLGPDGDATSFKPWGNGDQCVTFNILRAVSEYRFSCVEQYAIHEVGHAIGFIHEWSHPETTEACSSVRGDAGIEQPFPWSEASSAFDIAKQVTVVSSSYDWNSIMAYDAVCADVTGERFGSETLSPTDIEGAVAVYPPLMLGSNDVGVIPNLEDECPDGKLVNIVLDNEDAEQNNSDSGWIGKLVIFFKKLGNIFLGNEEQNNTNSGWIGAISQDGNNTHFRYCRVDGNKFGALSGSSGLNNYAVLLLGDTCPSGSVHFKRYHDDENQPPLGQSWMSGEYGITEQSLGGGTTMHFCLFPETSGTPDIFLMPNLGFDYGVLAGTGFSEQLATGTLYTDDEDVRNQNRLTMGDDSAVSVDNLSRINTFMEADGNTFYRLALA